MESVNSLSRNFSAYPLSKMDESYNPNKTTDSYAEKTIDTCSFTDGVISTHSSNNKAKIKSKNTSSRSLIDGVKTSKNICDKTTHEISEIKESSDRSATEILESIKDNIPIDKLKSGINIVDAGIDAFGTVTNGIDLIFSIKNRDGVSIVDSSAGIVNHGAKLVAKSLKIAGKTPIEPLKQAIPVLGTVAAGASGADKAVERLIKNAEKHGREFSNEEKIKAVVVGSVAGAGMDIVGDKLALITGSVIGSAICPGVGTAVGFIVGWVSGKIGGPLLAILGADVIYKHGNKNID